MEIINFEEAKARKYSKEKATKHLLNVDDSGLELQRQYRELAQFYNQFLNCKALITLGDNPFNII